MASPRGFTPTFGTTNVYFGARRFELWLELLSRLRAAYGHRVRMNADEVRLSADEVRLSMPYVCLSCALECGGGAQRGGKT